MKKQLITMGAVGLAMAGMNSGACADEVQAHPAATPNAVQTEAKTPQQQADSAREELERAGDEQAAARQNVAERQEEVQRKQDEYNQAVSGQEQAQKNADAKFQDLNEARKKKDEATQPKLDKAEEDADRARQEQLAAERVLEQAEEQQKKTQEAEDAARNDVNDVRKKVDAAAEDVNRARDIYDNRNEAKAERELEDARTELDSRKDDLSRSEQDLEQNHAAQEKMEQEFRELVKKDNAAHKVTDHWEYRLKSPSVNTDDRMKQLSADFIGVVRDYLAGKADEKTYRDACSAYEQSIYYGVELNGYTVTRRNDAGIPNEWSIKLDTDKTENDEAVDVNNLTQAQIENITNYVAYLINSVRDQLGFTPLTGHVTTSSDAQKALDAAKRNAKAAENEISELKNAGKEYQKALAAFEKAQAELEAAEKNTSARRQAQRDAQAALEAAKEALAAADAKVREKQQAYDAALLALEVRRQQNLLAQKNQSHVDTTPLVLKAKKIPGVQTEQGKEALPQMGDAAGKSAAVSSAGAVLTAFAGIMAMFGLTERRKRGN